AVGPIGGGQTAAHPLARSAAARGPHGSLRLPVPAHRLLERVRQYLTRRRGLSATLLDPFRRSRALERERSVKERRSSED
ncbi:MAG TPA: hypothetical protein VMV69_21260, partial [Pirellulales bacterium]|nr:hypothetical protein [Pirellulales bacterium]